VEEDSERLSIPEDGDEKDWAFRVVEIHKKSWRRGVTGGGFDMISVHQNVHMEITMFTRWTRDLCTHFVDDAL
jgi:hypothetical protein